VLRAASRRGSIPRMDLRGFLRSYARSPLGIGSLALAVVAAFAVAASGLSAAIAAAAFAGVLVAPLLLGFVFGFAQRAAVDESGRAFLAEAESRLAEAAEARRRLAAMRLADPAVAAARDLLVFEAGRLVEDCRRAGTYDPEGVQAVIDSLSLVDAWLKEADESSREKRFGLADEHPFPEAAARTAEALRAKAALVSARRSSATGEIPGADRIAIEEELK
jgi:hypothetical protein